MWNQFDYDFFVGHGIFHSFIHIISTWCFSIICPSHAITPSPLTAKVVRTASYLGTKNECHCIISTKLTHQ